MPIYEVTEQGVEAKRLVKADSAAQAVRHCAANRFTTRTINKVEDAAVLLAAGVPIETAGDEPKQPEPEQQPEPETPQTEKPLVEEMVPAKNKGN